MFTNLLWRILCVLCLTAASISDGLLEPKRVATEFLKAVDHRNVNVAEKYYRPRLARGKIRRTANQLFAADAYSVKSRLLIAISANTNLVYVEYLVDVYKKSTNEIYLERKLVDELQRDPKGHWFVTVCDVDSEKVIVDHLFPNRTKWNHERYLQLHPKKSKTTGTVNRNR